MWKLFALASIALGLYILDIDSVKGVSINSTCYLSSKSKTRSTQILCVMLENDRKT